MMDKLLLEEIIDRYKHPHHRGQNTGQKLNVKNVSCGDDITLYIDIKDGIVRSAKFDGSLCSIANYGAESLLDRIIGQEVNSISKITSRELLNDRVTGLLENPVRLKCFELSQIALIKLVM
jgi:nitrogen fixation NifU-like protein